MKGFVRTLFVSFLQAAAILNNLARSTISRNGTNPLNCPSYRERNYISTNICEPPATEIRMFPFLACFCS